MNETPTPQRQLFEFVPITSEIVQNLNHTDEYAVIDTGNTKRFLSGQEIQYFGYGFFIEIQVPVKQEETKSPLNDPAIKLLSRIISNKVAMEHISDEWKSEVQNVLALSARQVKEITAKDFIYGKYPHLKHPQEGSNPIIELELDEICNWLNEFNGTQITSLPVSKNKELLNRFITEIKNEFKNENWDYLDFIAERVLGSSPVVDGKEAIE